MLLPIVNGPASAGTELPGQALVRPSTGAPASDPALAQRTPELAPAGGAPVDGAALQDALERVKEKISTAGADLRFETDKETGRTIVQVVDAQTNEVIRQIPSDEMLAIARNIDHMKGLLLKQKA
jgi:flagellar protein FlaG